jgi:hypothetical protein
VTKKQNKINNKENKQRPVSIFQRQQAPPHQSHVSSQAHARWDKMGQDGTRWDKMGQDGTRETRGDKGDIRDIRDKGNKIDKR